MRERLEIFYMEATIKIDHKCHRFVYYGFFFGFSSSKQ